MTPTIVSLPAGVSSEILLRRPDVIEAEYGLRAANADIGVARAQLFPSISLTGLLGFASNALGSLFDSAVVGLVSRRRSTATIFRRRPPPRQDPGQQAQRDAALASYRRRDPDRVPRNRRRAARRATRIDRQLDATVRLDAAARDALMLSNARYSARSLA